MNRVEAYFWLVFGIIGTLGVLLIGPPLVDVAVKSNTPGWVVAVAYLSLGTLACIPAAAGIRALRTLRRG